MHWIAKPFTLPLQLFCNTNMKTLFQTNQTKVAAEFANPLKKTKINVGSPKNLFRLRIHLVAAPGVHFTLNIRIIALEMCLTPSSTPCWTIERSPKIKKRAPRCMGTLLQKTERAPRCMGTLFVLSWSSWVPPRAPQAIAPNLHVQTFFC